MPHMFIYTRQHLTVCTSALETCYLTWLRAGSQLHSSQQTFLPLYLCIFFFLKHWSPLFIAICSLGVLFFFFFFFLSLLHALLPSFALPLSRLLSNHVFSSSLSPFMPHASSSPFRSPPLFLPLSPRLCPFLSSSYLPCSILSLPLPSLFVFFPPTTPSDWLLIPQLSLFFDVYSACHWFSTDEEKPKVSELAAASLFTSGSLGVCAAVLALRGRRGMLIIVEIVCSFPPQLSLCPNLSSFSLCLSAMFLAGTEDGNAILLSAAPVKISPPAFSNHKAEALYIFKGAICKVWP